MSDAPGWQAGQAREGRYAQALLSGGSWPSGYTVPWDGEAGTLESPPRLHSLRVNCTACASACYWLYSLRTRLYGLRMRCAGTRLCPWGSRPDHARLRIIFAVRLSGQSLFESQTHRLAAVPLMRAVSARCLSHDGG